MFVLIFIAALPAIVVFMWFRCARYPVSLSRFSFALLTGVASFFPALLLQNFFAAGNGIVRITGKWSLVAEIFLRIALTEELSRLLMLLLLFVVIRRIDAMGLRPTDTGPAVRVSGGTMASAAGLIAGLGFAIIESAVYGASDPGNALLRTFTAAPLHGACGFRVGSSAALFREHPAQALFLFFSAVIIHGIYNFMLIIPGVISSIAAILIALFALASSIMAIRGGMQSPDQM